MNDPHDLVLTCLEQGMPGISEAWGRLLAEASAVCFTSQNHTTGVELKVDGLDSTIFQVFWQNEITEQVLNAWDDYQDATEFGACGIAVLLILNLTEFTVVRRARKGTGVDYWLSHKDAEKPFQDAARLEVSGILKGTSDSVKLRLKRKVQQTAPSDGTLPVYVVVVEFSEPLSHVVQK